MFKLSINLGSSFSEDSINRKKQACAEVLLKQTFNRIWDGGDDDYRFPPLDFPRPDGTRDNPLYHTGLHLLPSIHTIIGRGFFGVASRFIGARVLNFGTVGKGGKLPSIVPKNAMALYVPISKAGQAAAPSGRVLPGALDRLQSSAKPLLKRGKDYLFLQKVDIRPRKFFRLSAMGRRELMQTFIRS